MSVLEFSQDTRISNQRLLFGGTELITMEPGVGVPESFYHNGYCLLDAIHSIDKARNAVRSLIASIDVRKLPIYKLFKDGIQLAKLDLIPVCHDIVPRTFQAMHFDMGHPFASPSAQTMYTMLALYKPKESGASEARTRIVSLVNLFEGVTVRPNAEQRLERYVRLHGDGWTSPSIVNTMRLANLARLVDAICDQHKMTKESDATTGEWFNYDNVMGDDAVERERAFFEVCGIDLLAHEKRIQVQPGQLLIVDNIRCAHGRIGPRKPQEIYQLLYGVRSVSAEAIAKFRHLFVTDVLGLTS